jgi:ribosomal protein L27
MGRDYTIFAKAAGRVKFAPYAKDGRKKVSIIPEAVAAG